MKKSPQHQSVGRPHAKNLQLCPSAFPVNRSEGTNREERQETPSLKAVHARLFARLPRPESSASSSLLGFFCQLSDDFSEPWRICF
jgi:hypothetical protein